MSHLPKQLALQGQLKSAVASPTRRLPPAAPPVYQPQPVPKVLQLKLIGANQNPARARASAAPSLAVRESSRQLRNGGSQRLMNELRFRSVSTLVQPALSPATHSFPRRATVQRFRSGIVQATRFYPNLHPGAVEPIDQSNIFRLKSFADQYRLHKVKSHGVNVPNQQYNFVRTREGETLLHARYRHPSMAEGKQVLYAGEIFFNNGQLQWWSNGSGHYQPDQDSAEQANLPMDHFFSYQQIIKGEHTRRKKEFAR